MHFTHLRSHPWQKCHKGQIQLQKTISHELPPLALMKQNQLYEPTSLLNPCQCQSKDVKENLLNQGKHSVL